MVNCPVELYITVVDKHYEIFDHKLAVQMLSEPVNSLPVNWFDYRLVEVVKIVKPVQNRAVIVKYQTPVVHSSKLVPVIYAVVVQLILHFRMTVEQSSF